MVAVLKHLGGPNNRSAGAVCDWLTVAHFRDIDCDLTRAGRVAAANGLHPVRLVYNYAVGLHVAKACAVGA